MPYTIRTVLAHLAAFMHGTRDGWRQPYECSTSTPIEWAARRFDRKKDLDTWQLQNTLDRGITFGQHVRSPLNHQRFSEN